MSSGTWEVPIITRSVSEYYSKKQGFSIDPVAAIAAWLIDQLEEKLDHQTLHSGKKVPIKYSWWNSIEPKRKLDIPSVVLAVDLMDEPRDMNYGVGLSTGVMVPGRLMKGQIHIITLARSTQQRDIIEDHVVAVLEKVVSTDNNQPILWMDKDAAGLDKGFSTTDRYMATQLYQMMAELGFVKLTKVYFGVVRDYVNIYEYADNSADIDTYFDSIIQTYSLDPEDTISTWKSVKLTFTPNHF